ncbi:tRNA pseudouridine(54/55) synthase Pus10 [Halobacteriales archaeon QS_4_69_34]|nr:MAG: tRNA pseudouridine(54/55) synthase Pus10 [Halobacteriales archaeon QS_4_69_34]
MTILDDARAVIAEGPVCDACVGRAFAERSFGLSNAERGRALRVTVALDADESVDEFELDGECWVCEGECARFETWAERCIGALSEVDLATYQVGTRVPPLIEANDRLLRESAGFPEDAGESFKSELNREVGKRVGERTGTAVDFERPDVLCLLNLEREDVDVQINPAFVYGRYRKLERGLPQTEWPCRVCGGSGKQLAVAADGEDGDGEDDGSTDGGANDGTERSAAEEPCEHCGGSGYLYEASVEELTVPPVVEAMDGAAGVFHGAGREDVDARMLGTGRPFVIEVKEPRRRAIDTEELEAEIEDFAGGRVAVEGLGRATHEMVERVKELDASKTYRMTVEFAEPVVEEALADALAALDGATIAQRTPGRVDHRRADRVRTREVYRADGELDDPRHATIEVDGAGGLYVKELVSGDADRTAPSLAGQLGVDATVTALDVLAVEGEEPFADPAYLHGT